MAGSGGSGGRAVDVSAGSTGAVGAGDHDAGVSSGGGGAATGTTNRDAAAMGDAGGVTADAAPGPLDGRGGTGGASTGGIAGAAGVSGNDPLNAGAKCSSNKTWSTGNSQNMAPGRACPDCHSNFQLAGTLFPSGHEPDNCDGVDGLATNVYVVVTDATGRQITLYPNTVGNFYTSIAVTPPFTAKVVASGKERTMLVPQTIISCNTCHTQTGANGAPGRITLPY